MRPAVQEGLAKGAMFCNYCEGQISGAAQATKDTAKICEKRFEQALGEDLEMIATEITREDLEIHAEHAHKTSEGDVDCDGETEMGDVEDAEEPKLTRSGHGY